jgi:hypothetical protein
VHKYDSDAALQPGRRRYAGPDAGPRAWDACPALARRLCPGVPLVGHASGARLREALDSGFVAAGQASCLDERRLTPRLVQGRLSGSSVRGRPEIAFRVVGQHPHSVQEALLLAYREPVEQLGLVALDLLLHFVVQCPASIRE